MGLFAASKLGVGWTVVLPVLAVLVLTAREMALLAAGERAERTVRALTVAAWPATAAAVVVLLIRFLRML